MTSLSPTLKKTGEGIYTILGESSSLVTVVQSSE